MDAQSFCKIDLIRIDSNEFCEIQDNKVEFAKLFRENNFILDEKIIDEYRKDIYGEGEESKKFISVFCYKIKSFYKLGYINFLNNPEKACELLGNKHFYDVLPRVFYCENKFCIDDGRHRLAILKALGKKYTPAVIIKFIRNVEGFERLNLLDKLAFDIFNNLLLFKNSKIWKEFIKTEDYKLCAPKE